VDLPRDGLRALRAAKETGGAYVSVPDSAILEAIAELGRDAAVFAEPAGAAAYAGLLAAVEKNLLVQGERVVVLNTGNGLKDVARAMDAAGEPIVIEPTIKALQIALDADARKNGGG
jgi:threonine synthase